MSIAVAGQAAPLLPVSGKVADAARSIIEVSHVEKVFVTVRNERIHALNDISLTVAEGEFVTIVGPSGCGAVW